MTFIWFCSTRAAKIALMCFGAAMLFCLILGGLFWARDAHMQNNFVSVTGRVTNNFISQDRRTSWADVEFELDGQIHTIRFDNFWIMNHQREFLINPNNPEEGVVASGVGASRMIAMISAGVLSLFTMAYLLNFLCNRKRDHKAGIELGKGRMDIV